MFWEAGTRMFQKLHRKKILQEDLMETPLRKSLTTFDLTILGISYMVGVGIYVLTGIVVKDIAGPGAIVSNLWASVAALLTSLCYAEFGARVPKAGSAYTYTYVTMGEFWAFIIGWNTILQSMLMVASIASGWSSSFDALMDNAIKNATSKYIGEMHGMWISNYPDFIAFLVIIVITFFVAGGAKISVNFNSLLTIINLLVLILIMTAGFAVGSIENWTNPDHGGFLPYGFSGVFGGVATFFYAYTGFEGITVASEEAKDPEKSLPIAIFAAIGVVTLLYVGSTAALTLMIPYYDIDIAAPFPAAFAQHGMTWAKIIIDIGILFALTTTLLAGLFFLPRYVYSIASDGLLFQFFAYVHPKTQTPIAAIFVFGPISGLLALLFDIEIIVNFVLTGALMSYIIVAASVIILRYETVSKSQFKLKPEKIPSEDFAESEDKKIIMIKYQNHDDIGKLKTRYERLPYLQGLNPSLVTRSAVAGIGVFMTAFSSMLFVGFDYVKVGTWWSLILLLLFGAGIVLCFLVLLAYEPNRSYTTFQVGGSTKFIF